MKKYLFLVLLSPVLAFAQNYTARLPVVDYFRTDRLGTQILNRAYTGTTVDTTQAFDCTKYSTVCVNVQSKDSASLTIKYQLSIDGVTWGVATTIDSLSTASNTGDFKSVNLTTTALGAYRARLIMSLNSSFRLGTSTATYTASYVLKP